MRKLDNTTTRLLSDPKKRRAWVIYQVTIQGTNLATIAREYGVSRSALYSAFRKPYPRMEKLIADAVDMTPQQLFAERYTADGLPARRKGRPVKKSVIKYTSRPRPGNTQRERAA